MSSSNQKTTHILHIDDEESILDLTRLYLTRISENPIKIDTITDSSSVLDHLKKKGYYDVIISDYEMPQLNGLDLLKELRAIDEKLANKVYLLVDCMSPVVIPEVIDYTDIVMSV